MWFLVTITLSILGAVFGFNLANVLDDLALKDCAKQNNVYECELKAVPKEQTK